MKILQTALAVLALFPGAYSMDGEDDSPIAIKPTNKECKGKKCDIHEIDESGLKKNFLNEDFLDIQLLQGLPKKRFKKVKRNRGPALDNMDGSSKPPKPEKIWYGEDGDSTMTLMKVDGSDGEEIVVGSMTDGDSVHHIARGPNGEPVVKTRKTKDFPREANPMYSGRKKDYEENDRRMLQQFQQSIFQDGLRGSANNSHRSLQYDDNGATLDILVAWTTKAECANSNLSYGCTRTKTTTDNMRAMIDLAIQETNTAYELSGVDAELRLVHAYLEPYYDESRGFQPTLNDLTNGKIGQVHAKQDDYGADLVALIIDHNDYCGIAWLGPEPDKMFSVTSQSCATGYYSFGHEIGHNLGCEHDKGTAGQCGSSKSNFGYRDQNALFRSILAYNCVAGGCDNNQGGGCPRVMRFSNKEFLYNGKKIGDAKHDNASRINAVKSIVAGYRQTKDKEVCTNNAAACDDGDACTENTCVKGECQWSVICPAALQKQINLPLDADTGNAGNMFKIKAKTLLLIKGIGIHTQSTGRYVLEVWTRRDNYVALGSQSGWVRVQEVAVDGQGEGKITNVPLFNQPVPVRNGETQAFYVTLQSTDLKYTKGTEEGAILKQNSDLIVYQGIGVAYPFGGDGGGDTWSPRVFNGQIKYSVVKPEQLEIGGSGTTLSGICQKIKGWKVLNRKGISRGCKYVGRRPTKRCPMKGIGEGFNTIDGYEACPRECDPVRCPPKVPDIMLAS